MLGCGGRKGRCGRRYERRCRKVCWGVGEVRGDVGKGEGGDVGKCVGAPHPNTFYYSFPIPLPTSFHHTPTQFPTHSIHSSTPLPTLLHSQYIFPFLPTHFPIPTLHPPYFFPQLPLHPNTLPHSPHALFHTSTHSFDYVAKLPCDDVTLINFGGKA